MSVRTLDGVGRRATHAGLALWFGLAILFLFAPLAASNVYSFNLGVVGKQTSQFTGWTLEWYPAAWNDLALRRSVQTSLYVAFWAALIALGMGASLGYALVRHPSPNVRRWLSGLTYILLIVPEVVIGVSLLLFYAVTGIPLGAATLIAGITPAAIAVTALIVRARALTLDPKLEEAAADLGSTRLKTLWFIVLPQLLPQRGEGQLPPPRTWPQQETEIDDPVRRRRPARSARLSQCRLCRAGRPDRRGDAKLR